MPTLLTLAFALSSLLSFLTDAPARPSEFDAPPAVASAEEKECVYVLGIPIYCK